MGKERHECPLCGRPHEVKMDGVDRVEQARKAAEARWAATDPGVRDSRAVGGREVTARDEAGKPKAAAVNNPGPGGVQTSQVEQKVRPARNVAEAEAYRCPRHRVYERGCEFCEIGRGK